jgi:hypothetical protein
LLKVLTDSRNTTRSVCSLAVRLSGGKAFEPRSE